MERKKLNIAIVADGTYPTAAYPLGMLGSADIIICCDASVLKLKGLAPNYIVGDMDTLDSQSQQLYKDIIHKSSCQQTNDQTKAFSFALGLIPEGTPAEIHIYGATGKREDHTLGNISLLLEYVKNCGKPQEPFGHIMQEGTTVDIITDHGIFTPHSAAFEHNTFAGQQISIFSLDSSVRIKSEGLLYPLNDVVFDFWWKASLNEAVGSKIKLEPDHPAPILLFCAYK